MTDTDAKALLRLIRQLQPDELGRITWARGRPPYGFRIVGPPGFKRLVKCARTRHCGKHFVKWRRLGHSWATIYNHCWKSKILTVDGREWSEGAIKRAVRGELLLQQWEAAHPDEPFEPDPDYED
jgi:hypothetical protein